MATPTQLNNTSNDVTIAVPNADNFVTIQLNPDSTNTYGSITVFAQDQNGFGASVNATLPLSTYLSSFKSLNPNVSSVVVTFNFGNYAGGGAIAYTISGGGMTTVSYSNDLSAYTSQMNAYLINVF